MIDVMKRLAELDAKNPQVVKENTNVAECGPMGMMGGMPGIHTPASINMTADSGSELTGMLRDIMQLAGVHKVEPEHLGVEHEPMQLMPEPGVAVGPAIAEPMGGADDMRSVLDKLNPEPASDDAGDETGDEAGGEEIGPFQGDDEGPQTGDEEGEEEDDEEEEETDEGQYDNTPADPNKANPFDSNEFANHENPSGGGETSNGEKRQSNLPTATFEALMKEYKQFIGEDEEETDEGIMDKAKAFGKKVLDKVGHGDDEEMIKDLQKKAGVPQTGKKPEKANESMDDILKLAGLK